MSSQPARELQRVIEALHRRGGDRERDVARNVLEHLLLGCERDYLIARALQQLGDGRGPRWRTGRHQAFESGKDAFSALDELAQLLVDGIVDGRCLVLGEHLLPRRVGTDVRVLGAVEAPTARSCCCRRSTSPERALEVRQRVRMARKWHTRPDRHTAASAWQVGEMRRPAPASTTSRSARHRARTSRSPSRARPRASRRCGGRSWRRRASSAAWCGPT